MRLWPCIHEPEAGSGAVVAIFFFFVNFFFFWWDWGLNPELRACKVGTQLLQPHRQFTLALILELGSCKLFAGAAPELQSSQFQPPK
jgi:hypothetical protein